MGSVLGAIVSGVFQEDSNKRSIKYQQAENQLNRDYNSAEAENARQFENEQRIASQEYQSAEWDRQQAYNTPAMQVQRLREGGINPAVYFSGSQVASGSSVSAPSGGSAPAASFHGGLSPTSIQLPSFGDIGQFMKDISEARKNVADTKTTDLMRDPMYRQALTQLVGQELANKSLELANKFNESTLPDRVKKEYHDAMYAALQCRLADTEDDLKQSENLLNRSMERLNHSLANKHGTEGLILLNELANWKTTYDSMIKVRRSEIERNKSEKQKNQAEAREYNASAESQEFYNKLSSDPAVRRSLTTELIELGKQAENKTLIDDRTYRLLEKQCAQLEKATDNYEIQMWSDIINKTLGTVISGLGEYTRFGLAKRFLAPQNKPDLYLPQKTTFDGVNFSK